MAASEDIVERLQFNPALLGQPLTGSALLF